MSAALSCQCDGPVNYVAIQILLAADCMQKNMCRELECAEHQDKDMRHETMIPAVRKQWKANPSANCRGAHAFRQVKQKPAEQECTSGNSLDLGVFQPSNVIGRL